MANTIGGGDPWKYTGLLNNCLQILVTVASGIVLAQFRVVRAATLVPPAVGAIPLLVLRGLGMVIDFYSDSFLWNYIGAFLVLRALALVVSIVGVLVVHHQIRRNSNSNSNATSGQQNYYGIGQVAVVWLSLTWISTVIIGTVVVDFQYGLLAGVSSFIFQLPVQLLLLECHLLEQEYLLESTLNSEPRILMTENDDLEAVARRSSPSTDPQQPEEDSRCSEVAIDEQETREDPETAPPTVATNDADSEDVVVILSDHHRRNDGEPFVPLSLWLDFLTRRSVWKRITIKVLTNPIIWGILGGFFLTLTKLGPRYLNPKSDEYVPGLGWIFATCKWFGDMVSPLSLFTMGVWMHGQGIRRLLFQVPVATAVLCMVSKLVLVPLVMVGLAYGLSLDDEAGRAAVLIAALPISMASFSLASHYKIGATLLSENVALGTLLLLPTILLWSLAMDRIGIFVTD